VPLDAHLGDRLAAWDRLTATRQMTRIGRFAMSDPLILRLRDGRSFALVQAEVDDHWSFDAARQQLRDAVEDNAFVGYELVRLADTSCLSAAFDPSVDEAIDAIARAIERGVIEPIRFETIEPGLRPPTFGEVVDWDNATPLADLRRDEPPAVVRPRVEPRPTWTDPLDAWLSFEVVDDRGLAAAGTFACTITGDVTSGALDRRSHEFRGLSTSASGRVQIRELSFAAAVTGFDGPVPGGTPVSPVSPHEPSEPSEPGPGQTSFEIVDEDGAPLSGQYVVSSDGESRGELAGVVTIESHGPMRLRVILESGAPRG